MPADQGDDADRTEETPLVVPVSDTVGAVDLDPAIDGRTDDAPADRGATTEQVAVQTSRTAATETLPATTPVAGVPLAEVSVDDRVGRRRRRWPRRLLVGVAVVVVLAFGYYAFNLWQVWSTGRSDQARPVDAVVVMGAAQYDGRPSPQLEARLDHVITLWEQGLAPNVIVTGGNLPGDRFTEAEASGGYLIERGVPPDAILYENVGSNSYDSLVGVAAIMTGRGLDEALIVTDPYHALRSRMTAEELGISAFVSPTPTSVVAGGTELRRELGEAAGVAVGRLVGFDRLASWTG